MRNLIIVYNVLERGNVIDILQYAIEHVSYWLHWIFGNYMPKVINEVDH